MNRIPVYATLAFAACAALVLSPAFANRENQTSKDVKIDSLVPGKQKDLNDFCAYHPRSGLCAFTPNPPAVRPPYAPPGSPVAGDSGNSGSGPIKGSTSYPIEGSHCSGKYKTKWEGVIPDSQIGKPAMPFFISNPPGWNMVRKHCVAQRPEYTMTTSCNNFRIAKHPDGSTALEMFVPKGVKPSHGLSMRVTPANTYAACASVDLWVPVNWQMPRPKHGMKWGLGLWGGGAARCATGGCSGSKQDGFTMRLEIGSNLNPHIYSYHLNRKSGDFGETSVSSQILARGRWVTVEQELIMENPGRADGVENMYLNGTKVSTQTGLVFGRDRGWYIKGYNFSDLWGGHAIDHQSPVDQSYWYKNMRVYY